MTKISIILPVYNVGKYLKECLDSITNQSLTDFEVICVNDGSTDNSLEILNEYAQKDNRFVIYSQENQGQGVARNKGIEMAKGKYIQFIDPDDWIELNMLEELYNFAEEKSANIVRFDYKNYDEYVNKTRLHTFKEDIKENYNYDIKGNFSYNWKLFKKGCMSKLELMAWIYLYKRQFILDNNICFAPTKRGEDHLFSLSAILCADKIYYLDKYLYTYRSRQGSTVNSVGEDNMLIFDNIKRIKEFLLRHSLYQELEEEFLNYSHTCLRWHYEQTPKHLVKQYETLCRDFFETDKEFKKWLIGTKTNRNFIENIFSLKNKKIDGVKYKAITILGITFMIKPKRGVISG